MLQTSCNSHSSNSLNNDEFELEFGRKKTSNVKESYERFGVCGCVNCTCFKSQCVLDMHSRDPNVDAAVIGNIENRSHDTSFNLSGVFTVFEA